VGAGLGLYRAHLSNRRRERGACAAHEPARHQVILSSLNHRSFSFSGFFFLLWFHTATFFFVLVAFQDLSAPQPRHCRSGNISRRFARALSSDGVLAGGTLLRQASMRPRTTHSATLASPTATATATAAAEEAAEAAAVVGAAPPAGRALLQRRPERRAKQQPEEQQQQQQQQQSSK